MLVGRILSVDARTRRASVQVETSSGIAIYSDVFIGEPSPNSFATPDVDTNVVISKSGPEWIITNYLWPDDESTALVVDEMGVMPGDNFIGNNKYGFVGVMKGGLVGIQGDPATGVFVSKQNKSVNIAADEIAILNSAYQKYVTVENGGCKITEIVARAIDGANVMERTLDANSGEMIYKYNHLNKITIEIDQNNPLLPVEGVEVSIKTVARNGKTVNLSISPETGDIVLSGTAQGIINMEKVLLGIDMVTSLLQGVVTGETPCQATGLPHLQCSKKVFAQKDLA